MKMNRKMKKIILMAVVALMATMSAEAQRIRTIDKDGQPVPYVSVLTTDARYIGVTDINGVIEDVKGADTISVSHVAYKPKLYKVNGKSGTITLEDADFGLPEIVVKKKPLVYVQTYYRVYFYDDEYGVMYYRVGFTDNVYDRVTKKLKTSTTHTSKAIYAILKTAFNALAGNIVDKHSQINMKPLEERIKERYKDIQVKITDEGNGRKRISDFKGTIGYIVDNKEAGQRRFSYDQSKIRTHVLEVKGKEKKLKKRETKKAKERNREDADFELYRIDDDGRCTPEDFMMSQWMTSYDEDNKKGESVHKVHCVQVFATDRAYVDKDELKQLKKENKMKMTYQNILQFEHAHKIPALAPAIQKKLNELWKMEE